MIRVGPVGIILAILFIAFGPHNSFYSSNRWSQAETQPGPLSSILPDAANLSDQPSRGNIDAVQTRQGWMIRIASRRRMVENTLIALVVVAFAWPLRKKALAREREEEANRGEDELPDDD